jgi:hypothetical protein
LTREQVDDVLERGPVAMALFVSGQLKFGRDHDFWWHRGQLVLPRLKNRIRAI